MKYLIIDDLAAKGWRAIIEKAVIRENNNLESANNYEEAIEQIKTEWGLIFLDMRLNEDDHRVNRVEDYSGFKILKEIRKDFNSINYSTPIILLTASNKIWNINAFLENGCDGYYIKEHPNFHFSKESSIQNLENLQNDFAKLIVQGNQRREVWELCNEIINTINKHQYFTSQDKRYNNVLNRIIDKLKLGYSQLFQKQKILEKDILLAYNESLSFIVFWSILEEISKGFTNINETWDGTFERKENWKFRNNEYFIEYEKQKLTLNYSFKSGEFHKEYKTYDLGSKVYDKYSSKLPVNLSEQMYSLISAYATDNSLFREISKLFKEINSYRNNVDFIHNSVQNIITKDLIDENSVKNAYQMNLKILNLILRILKLSV